MRKKGRRELLFRAEKLVPQFPRMLLITKLITENVSKVFEILDFFFSCESPSRGQRADTSNNGDEE